MNQKENKSQLNNELSFLSPYFLGSHGENSKVLEELMVDFVRDHVYWRRNFHPEDNRPISPQMTRSSEYNDAIAKISNELHSLTAELKRTIPIYSPRYLGHMSSDLMLPALLAQLVTTFYNPNNSAADGAEVTVEMELAVGKQFADMFGYNTDPSEFPCAWGHLTSGGSGANYESLWNFRAVKYYPVALIEALKQMDIELSFDEGDEFKSPFDYSPWELANFSISSVLKFREKIFRQIKEQMGKDGLRDYSRRVEDNRLESLGPAQFFAEHWKFHQPVVLVPSTAYSFWKKAMRLLGFGSASLLKVPLTSTMRMDEQELERILKNLQSKNIPVLAVIGVLGTVEFGTIDPIHSLVKLKKQFSQEGFHFHLHVDASNGGYLKSLFRDEDGKPIPRETLQAEHSYFPSQDVYDSFMALPEVSSISLAPHTSGYLPQGIGCFISRNREIVKLLNHSERNLLQNDDKLDLLHLSRFILDGAKPGANAAAAYLTHKVLPLNSANFGRVVKQTIRCAEYFFNKIEQLKKKLEGKAYLSIPFEPDTNLVAIAINPVDNNSLTDMNVFVDKVAEALAYNQEHFVQTKDFLGSTTRLELKYLSGKEKKDLFKLLHLDIHDVSTVRGDKVHILRHTMINPWLAAENDGLNYLDHYCDFLEKTILQTLEKHS